MNSTKRWSTRAGWGNVLASASTWRIEDITHERVVVTLRQAFRQDAFWHGDGPGRPLELGRRSVRSCVKFASSTAVPIERLQQRHGLDDLAAENLLSYLTDQAEATGVVPDDRSIVVERDRRLAGMRAHAVRCAGSRPWAMALQARLGEEWSEIDLMWSDDGIVMRLPEALDRLPLDSCCLTPMRSMTSLFLACPIRRCSPLASSKCSARALLLPRRRPDQRTPLWQQRRGRRSAQRGRQVSDLPNAARSHPRVRQRRVRPAGAAFGDVGSRSRGAHGGG